LGRCSSHVSEERSVCRFFCLFQVVWTHLCLINVWSKKLKAIFNSRQKISTILDKISVYLPAIQNQRTKERRPKNRSATESFSCASCRVAWVGKGAQLKSTAKHFILIVWCVDRTHPSLNTIDDKLSMKRYLEYSSKNGDKSSPSND
jgi:hypothetical protein